MNSQNRYPTHNQIIDQSADLDGYVAATHEPHSISANAFELRDRKTNKALAPAQAYPSDGCSTQQRGVLRGVIALLQMSSDRSSLHVYTTSLTVADGLSGGQTLKANADLLEMIRLLERQKEIDLQCYHCGERDQRRPILNRLLELAKKARNKRGFL